MTKIGRLLEASASKALAKTTQAYERKCTQLISQNGAFAGFPGDIVDTGALRASKEVRADGPLARTVSYGNTAAPYALFVHEGYTLRSGREQPGRPWLRRAEEELDLQGIFTEAFNEALNAQL